MITNISYRTNYNNFYTNKNISFRQNVHSLANIDIGRCLEGCIGKVKVLKGKEENYLRVYKKILGDNVENYTLKNDNNEIIGNINLIIIKSDPRFSYSKNDYVFLDELRNFSKPNTPYHNKNLAYYRNVGTRLMQIALKRSYDAGCNGNLKLISVEEALDWYFNIIGMEREQATKSLFKIFNPNYIFLPDKNKKRLEQLQGGL